MFNWLKKNAGVGRQTAGTATIPTPVSLAALKQLIPIGRLPNATLLNLNIGQRSYHAGEIVFTRGDSIEAIPYLQEGEIYLEAANGSGYTVNANTFKACYPLSTGSEHCYSAIARSSARILYLPLHTLGEQLEQPNPLIRDDDIPESLAGSRLFHGICAAYRKNEIRIPALPDVTIRLRNALQKDIGIQEAVKIVNLDPVISSKLIQVVNSPLYQTLTPATTCFQAVNRLGLKTTLNWVTSISLNNLFVFQNKQLHALSANIWKNSIHVASLSYTLASVLKAHNPDEALLAGLVHNIGALPIIMHAENLAGGGFTLSELEQTLALLQGPLGTAILDKWHFPGPLKPIPQLASNWYGDHGPALQLADLVVLAKFHSLIGSDAMHKLPPLNTLPAFHKLGSAELTPDMSLQILSDAKNQIADALKFF